MLGRLRGRAAQGLRSAISAIVDFVCLLLAPLMSILLCLGFTVFFAVLRLPILSIFDKYFYGVRENRKRGFQTTVMPISSRLNLHSELYHDYLEVEPGIRLHYASIGLRRDQPLMLFLHGFPEVSSYSMNPIYMKVTTCSAGTAGDIN